MFDKSENIEEFDDEFDGESYHSFTESIHDFSQIVTSNNRDTKNYMALKEHSNYKFPPQNKDNKRVVLRAEDNDSLDGDKQMLKTIESQIKKKTTLAKIEKEEQKLNPIQGKSQTNMQKQLNNSQNKNSVNIDNTEAKKDTPKNYI